MADPALPTRQYPYRRPDSAAGPEPALGLPLAAGTLYRYVVGLDPAPQPLTAEEIEALHDPFATGLLGRDSFPMTLRELPGTAAPGSSSSTHWASSATRRARSSG